MSAPASQQAETQSRPFGSPAPPAAPAAGDGASGMQPPAVSPRLEAFNMAKSGASRDEVARHLKEKFGLEHPQEILNDAFLRSGR